LSGAVRRDDTSTDTLYFKFHVDPLSDVSTEEYYAGFQLYEGNERRLAIGNSPAAWAYSAFYTSETWPTNKVPGDFDLSSSRPELFSTANVQPYELPRRGNPRTIVFKVQYVAGGDDLVTVWLSPGLARGDTEQGQTGSLTTRFKANASFNEVRLRHVGGGGGWRFSEMTIATEFDDFIVRHFWQTWWFMGLAATGVLAAVGTGIRVLEKRKYQFQLQRAEQEHALERERARIAQDLHDDLGSSLTRISLLSELARADKNDPAQLEIHMREISQSAAQTVRALEEIVWAVRPGSDSLQGLVEYIAHVANETFAGSNTRCRLDLPHDLPVQSLPPEMRHNIFLIVKEALTNALKHASAHEVHVRAKVLANSLEIVVRDDGRGFAPDSKSGDGQRNGMENMRRRGRAVGADLSMGSEPGKGTTVKLTVRLPEPTAS
jgi:signal transduction histidine kinase